MPKKHSKEKTESEAGSDNPDKSSDKGSIGKDPREFFLQLLLYIYI